MSSIDNAKASVQQLLEKVQALHTQLQQVADLSDAQPSFTQMSKQMDQVRDIMGQGRSEMSAFVGDVGRAVMAAQQQLDDRSVQYMQQTEDLPGVHPSVFRIPNASAEFKFAMERSEGQSLNLLLYGESEQAKEMHQQSLRIDIQAVPPSPDDPVAVQQRLTVILDPAARRQLLASSASRLQAAKVTDANEILFLRLPSTTSKPDATATKEAVLAIALTPEADIAEKSRGLSLWSIINDDPVVVQDLVKIATGGNGAKDAFAELRASLRGLAKRQATLLADDRPQANP